MLLSSSYTAHHETTTMRPQKRASNGNPQLRTTNYIQSTVRALSDSRGEILAARSCCNNKPHSHLWEKAPIVIAGFPVGAFSPWGHERLVVVLWGSRRASIHLNVHSVLQQQHSSIVHLHVRTLRTCFSPNGSNPLALGQKSMFLRLLKYTHHILHRIKK